MSKPQFDVRILRYELIKEIDGAWTADDFNDLLLRMDCSPGDTTSAAELRDLCLMCLQDREADQAAEIVLKQRLGSKLSAGQIQNTAVEMADEKLWEQYADLSLHEELFNVGSLMFDAFPEKYFEPDSVKLSIQVSGQNSIAAEILARPLRESMLVRLLADGMDDNSILHRLFDDQLTGTSFPEAESIVWIVGPCEVKGNMVSLEIISSAHWLDSLKDVDVYQSTAAPDVCHR